MASEQEIEAWFWKDLKAAPFVMLGLQGDRDGHTQPMTAQFEEDGGPLFFFTAKDNGLVQGLEKTSQRAIASYVAKGHDLFASIHGSLSEVTDNAVIDRLWNPHVEAWFEGGRNDPRLCLLKLDTEKAQLWLGGSSIGAMITRLLGRDPKQSYEGKTAEVAL